MAGKKPVRIAFSVGFQVKYCLAIISLFVCASFLLYSVMNKALAGSYLESLRTLYYLDQNLPFYLSIMVLLLVLFILILTLVITLLVSHQLAGPVFRFEKVLQELIAGILPQQISTRKTDQLKTTENAINIFSGRLRNVFEKTQALSEAMAVHDQGELPEAVARDVRRRIAEIRSAVNCQTTRKVVE